jgi:ELAV like protein 2/3/4
MSMLDSSSTSSSMQHHHQQQHQPSSAELLSSRTNLIVNYLPQTMTGDELKRLFESIGPLESCKLVRNKLNNQSLCYGFVNFATVADADAALRTLNGIKIENKIIKVSLARPSSETIKGANLYVCGIPRHWSTDDLKCCFSQCGQTITSRILNDPTTGQPKGVGFVRYDQRFEAELAIEKLNGKTPAGSVEPLVVKFASQVASTSKAAAADVQNFMSKLPSPVESGSEGSKTILHTSVNNSTTSVPSYFTRSIGSVFSSTEFMQYNGGGDACLSLTPTGQIHLSSSSQTDLSSAFGVSGGWCIFVYNLSPETQESSLWQLFGPFGAVQSVKVARNYGSQKCKGFAFVTMGVYEEALGAIANLNGVLLGDRVLQVSFKTN